VSPPLDLHPEMMAQIEAAKALPPATSVAAWRANWTVYTNATRRPYPPGMLVEDRAIAVGGRAIKVRVYRPAGLATLAPCIAYFHGGGFMKGDCDSSDTAAWGLAEESRAVLVSVDYRLAPEYPYPAAFDDCFEVTAHLAWHGRNYGIDGKRLAVAGDSAGGNLAAAVALAARDRRGPALAAQALIYPTLTTDLSLPSYRANGDGPGLTTAAMELYWRWYLPGGNHRADAYAAPLLASDLAGLPATFIHTAEYDPLHDDGVRYAERLRAAGVAVDYRLAARMVHGFLRARFQGPATAAEFQAITGFLRRRLNQANA
jgi:acetyl esterase